MSSGPWQRDHQKAKVKVKALGLSSSQASFFKSLSELPREEIWSLEASSMPVSRDVASISVIFSSSGMVTMTCGADISLPSFFELPGQGKREKGRVDVKCGQEAIEAQPTHG